MMNLSNGDFPLNVSHLSPTTPSPPPQVALAANHVPLALTKPLVALALARRPLLAARLVLVAKLAAASQVGTRARTSSSVDLKSESFG
jgi:hypothetical protein